MQNYNENEDETLFAGPLPPSLLDRCVWGVLMVAGYVTVVLTGIALVATVCAVLTVLLALAAWLLPELVRLRMNGGSAGPALVGCTAAFASVGLAALTYALREVGVWLFERADELE